MIKTVFLQIAFVGFIGCNLELYGAYDKVRIGTIDAYYKNKISKNELRIILDEIEKQFEKQLGFNVFDYSKDGKPINLLYVPPLKLEEKIRVKQKRLKKKKKILEQKRKEFNTSKDTITKKQRALNNKIKSINKETISLNNYIRNANKKQNISQSEYNRIKTYIEKKQTTIKDKRDSLREKQKLFQKEFDSYNRKIFNYNNLIREYNRLGKEITRLSRSIKKVKGRTFGYQEIELKTYYKNGRKIKEKKVKSSMNKIEIYGFDSRNQLKAIIAHEIGHLVGIPHIRKRNALMHPVLQKNQVNALHLIKADIRNFKKNF